MKNYDLIVIGGGPMGLATAYQASLRGKKTLVLEQFGFLNNQGSSAGASRQFRLQYAEKYMAELALASQDFWSQLQRYSQHTLVERCGSLWFGDPKLSSQEGGIEAAENVMNTLNIPFRKLSAANIEKEFSFKDLPPKYTGFFQPDGGIINLKATEEVLYNQCLASGLVDLFAWQKVTGLNNDIENEILVSTECEEYQCSKLAITTGPYVNNVMEKLDLKVPIDIWQMSSAYFKKTDPNLYLPTWFVFQEQQSTSLFYGFPEVDWSHPGYLRVATDFPDHGIIKNPSQRSLAPSSKSLSLDSQWVNQHMQGLEATPHFTSTCLIALSEDPTKELLLDYLPKEKTNNKNIVVYSAGWAGKFIPILGDMINQMLYEDITEFNYRGYQIALKNFSINWK